jgi:hypothetical protein
MGDILFKTIERFQGTKAWGRILDAGTGPHSMNGSKLCHLVGGQPLPLMLTCVPRP